MIAMHLLLLATIVAYVATRLLPKARWVDQAPGLGLAAWYAVLATVVASGVGAAVSLLARWPATQQTVCAWWALCVDVLTGHWGDAGRITGWLGVAALVSLAVMTARKIGQAVIRIARARRAHMHAVTLVGRPHPRLDAYVVEDERPAAYAIGGRAAKVVITTGALDTLPQAQVAAILAHEHAHNTRHHHLFVAGARLLADAFPGIAVFTDAHRHIDPLVELHADDIAARHHHRLDLAHALVACAEAAARPRAMTVPAMAMPAHGGDALQRVQRLLTPPDALTRTHRLALTVALSVLTLTPVAVGVLGIIFPALGACLPMPAG